MPTQPESPVRTFATVALDCLVLSRFNARHTRTAATITTLAERMRRNGFEATRALWVSPGAGETYEVFAGGTRLAAAREAHLTTVPVLIHTGYTDAAISGLADQDNENDEYHIPVPLPEIWAEYQRLKEEEQWTQQQIADAKGVPQQRVAERLQYAAFPPRIIRAFTQSDFLKESHALELSKLHNLCNLTPWLTRDAALVEILEGVLEKHRGSSQKVAPTASVFAREVKVYNDLVKTATQALADLPRDDEQDSTAALLAALAAKKIRTTKDVLLIASQIAAAYQVRQRARLAALTEAKEQAEREAAALEADRMRRATLEAYLASFLHGDNQRLIPTHCPSEIRLILTDPPYGKQFQSKRHVTSGVKPLIIGDESLARACADLLKALTALEPKLAADVHLMVFTHQDSYRPFLGVITQCGWTIRRTMTWMKGTHGLGDTTRGEVLTETEWIIHAVRGNPKFTEDVSRKELLDFPGVQQSDHPMAKPPALCAHLIALATSPGDVVVDPFAGAAPVICAAFATGRRVWGCEIEDQVYRLGSQNVQEAAQARLARG
jgi:DNA modification methylase/ParB-like chromosome segregation protein Spo0J